MSTFSDYNSLLCLLSETTIVCSVRFFRLQKLVVSAFSDYNSLWCPLLETGKFVGCVSDILFAVFLTMYKSLGIWLKDWDELTFCLSGP